MSPLKSERAWLRKGSLAYEAIFPEHYPQGKSSLVISVGLCLGPRLTATCAFEAEPTPFKCLPCPHCFETNSVEPEIGIGTVMEQMPATAACRLLKMWWPGTESNRRRQPFQGCALPTELPGQFWEGSCAGFRQETVSITGIPDRLSSPV